MKAKRKRLFLAGIPSWGLAGLTLVTTIFIFIILSFFGDLMKINENISEPIFYIFFDLFIVVCCFFIVRQNPTSIWYVPIICNVIGIISAIIEPTFWVTSLWMFICGGWVLSIIASAIGYRIGKSSE